MIYCSTPVAAVLLPKGAVAPNAGCTALPNAGAAAPNAGVEAPKPVPPKTGAVLPKAGVAPNAGAEVPNAGLEAAPKMEGADIPPKVGMAACSGAALIPGKAVPCCPFSPAWECGSHLSSLGKQYSESATA